MQCFLDASTEHVIKFYSFFPQYLQTLEARLKEAALKNTALLQENASLRKQMTVLEKEVNDFGEGWVDAF